MGSLESSLNDRKPGERMKRVPAKEQCSMTRKDCDMKRVFRIEWDTGTWSEWLLLAAAACLFSACAPTRAVYIPPESQHPAAQSVGPGQVQGQQSGQSDVQQPVMKPAPHIKEADVAQNPEAQATDSSSQQYVANPARSSDPQYLASTHLVDQGKASLAQGNADGAIAVLEQAVQVDVYNGDAFFGLARAWKMKGSQVKALEFANKAEILYQDSPTKLKQVYLLKAELFKELNDPVKMDYYLQKAARFD